MLIWFLDPIHQVPIPAHVRTEIITVTKYFIVSFPDHPNEPSWVLSADLECSIVTMKCMSAHCVIYNIHLFHFGWAMCGCFTCLTRLLVYHKVVMPCILRWIPIVPISIVNTEILLYLHQNQMILYPLETLVYRKQYCLVFLWRDVFEPTGSCR